MHSIGSHPQRGSFFRVEFPRRIVHARNGRNWSQKRLSNEAGIALSTLNEIEGGLAADLRVSTLLRLSAALGVAPNWLLGFDPERALPRCHGKRAPHSPAYEATSVRNYVANPALPCHGACFRCREPECASEFPILHG